MLNISPALYEAKINLEDSKGTVAFESVFKSYNQLVEQEAKANRVSSAEVMRYMDEAYADSEVEDWNWDFLNGVSYVVIYYRYTSYDDYGIPYSSDFVNSLEYFDAKVAYKKARSLWRSKKYEGVNLYRKESGVEPDTLLFEFGA